MSSHHGQSSLASTTSSCARTPATRRSMRYRSRPGRVCRTVSGLGVERHAGARSRARTVARAPRVDDRLRLAHPVRHRGQRSRDRCAGAASSRQESLRDTPRRLLSVSNVGGRRRLRAAITDQTSSRRCNGKRVQISLPMHEGPRGSPEPSSCGASRHFVYALDGSRDAWAELTGRVDRYHGTHGPVL